MSSVSDPTPPPAAESASPDHVDVLIIGAGLSGIGAACHLATALPGKTYAVLEGRGASGGTWDLFRYPGIRSDSDMYTLGYRFKPWTGDKAIADGAAIRDYIREAATEHGVDRHIRYHHRVERAEWSGAEARWTVRVHRADTGDIVTLTANFLFACTGYYRYDQGYTPEFAGLADYAGTVVHPQHWPEDLDYAGKRVAIIGSGATAVTLGPAMARAAAQVTMVQRSPTYILSAPSADAVALRLRRFLPERLAYSLTRLKNSARSVGIYELSRRRPEFAKKFIRDLQRRWLPDGYDIDTHFTPAYDPWDQRLCLVPDNDMFRAIRKGRLDIVTDRIERFTATGLRLESGRELDADVVVTATGLNLLAFGGIDLAVDGRPVDLTETMAFKGMMLSGLPNFAFVVGYTNASWTLKADLVCEYVIRLLKYMDARGHRTVELDRDTAVAEEPFLDFAAGYVLRSLDRFPKQGDVAPWRLRMNYFRDLPVLRYGPLRDKAMRFDRVPVPVPADR
ncbi:flavin-containing monooxygenase [Nocardia thailandica]|uniref:Flavin-containing monooxygenase n=1 Tax=Nocardia thailandica TaxID=257275 RepID=A0ABW6PIQ1_9NOCA